MSRRTLTLIFAVLLTTPLLAVTFPLTPSSGPTTGGTVVTLKGSFPEGIYTARFGAEEAAIATVIRVDAETLTIVTPPHLPGASYVQVFRNGTSLGNAAFSYQGGPPAAFERLLIPILLDPINGANGSLFVTSFGARLRGQGKVALYGFELFCPLSGCIYPSLTDAPQFLTPQYPQISNDDAPLVGNGNPGRFIYVPKNDLSQVAMSLRVFDHSRSTSNFGTEIPIVRSDDFARNFRTIRLLNVPTGPGFRNTLRIYGVDPSSVFVRVEGQRIAPVDHQIQLSEPTNIFEPATATFTTFPQNVGDVDVLVTVPHPPILPISDSPVWAFVSVTNNETQLITIVTPQP
jgi:hypothetical protein